MFGNMSADSCRYVMLTKYFLQEQGYACTESLIYQDNKSAMLLENNGCASSSKRTCHINICYYFVIDKIASNEVRIAYCPTEDMQANFFTKPTQGRKFTIFRDFILNIDPTSHVVLCHIGILPLSSLSNSFGGSVFFQSTNHRSVLNKQEENHESDWLLVIRRQNPTRHHKCVKLEKTS
jgi:hypothetical protein